MSSTISSGAPTPSRSGTEPRGAVRLTGRSIPLDRRVNAVRADLADIALAGRVIASRYVAPVPMMGALPSAALRARPEADAVQVSALLLGEVFAAFDRSGSWTWGQCGVDGYVGWIESSALTAAAVVPTHRITVAQALAFAAPSIKGTVVATLPLNATVTAEPCDADFIKLAGHGGYVHRRHVAPQDGDIVDLVHGFVGTPYRWGGRTRDGIDCSGLTQAVLLAHGVACPRDSDQQFAAFPRIAFESRRRGDLVCFPGHIGVLVDADHLLHANAWWMTTLIEPLAAVVERLAATVSEPILGIVRPPCGGSRASL